MGQGAETHILRWFVYKKGRGADDPRVHASFSEDVPSFPLPIRPLPLKVGTREAYLTAKALKGAWSSCQGYFPSPQRRTAGADSLFAFRDLPRPRQNPLSLVSLLYHKAMLGLRGS